jgi:protein TonB
MDLQADASSPDDTAAATHATPDAHQRPIADAAPCAATRTPAPLPPPDAPSVYGADSRPNIPAMAASVGVVGLVLSAFLTIGLVQAIRAKPVATVVRMVPERLELPPPPPPPPARSPQPQAIVTAPSPVVAPAPLVALPPVPVAVTTTPAPPPEDAVPGPPSPPAPAAAPAIANGGDLSSQMLSAPPPTYPMESRRRHEQGTVVLALLLSTDGRVAEISIARSSGSDRLDRAALNAVRRWRWSPTLRGGAAVMVRGTVEIPFVLAG